MITGSENDDYIYIHTYNIWSSATSLHFTKGYILTWHLSLIAIVIVTLSLRNISLCLNSSSSLATSGERRERERLSAKKIKLHSPNLIDEPRYGARVQVGVMSHYTRRLHTCSMWTIWPSFARKRAPRQQPKTRAFLVLLSRRTRDIAATRGRPEAPRGWSNAQASAGRCGRVLRCAPSTRASRPALHWRAVSDPKGEQGGIPKGQGRGSSAAGGQRERQRAEQSKAYLVQ